MKTKRHLNSPWLRCFLLSGLVVSGTTAAEVSTNNFSAEQLKQLSLEELLNQEVTLVTRQPQKLIESPSAVQVITGEDIRRSGATSIPEALRLAPNLNVAQANSSQWAISSRGFNQPGLLANKLLVMIDGRTVYTPLYGGVFWNVQNPLLADIDRIEIVSGPGATLWGANAVNGVINIQTKSSRDTQGTLVEGAGGSMLQDFGAVRYGGSAGTNLFYRVYGQRFDRNSTEFPNGNDATNSWDMTQGGFRTDWYPSEENTLTFQGDFYSGAEEVPAMSDSTVDGQNVLGRWQHRISDTSDFTLRLYFDRTWKNLPGTLAEDLKTYDVDLQHRFTLGDIQTVTWGGGYRLMEDKIHNTAVLAFLPPDKNLQLFSGFIQDQISLVPDRLELILGTKGEHNVYSGFEIQPSVRLAWTPDKSQTVWLSVSRAVRSPSRIDRNAYVPGDPPYLLAGGTNFTSEKVLAYELGYRIRPMSSLSLSVATFFNQYDDLRSVETNGTSLTVKNGLEAQSWGVETSGELRASHWWRLRGGYTYFHKDVWETPGHNDANGTKLEGNDPAHQVVLQSMWNLPGNVEFDLTGRYVSSLPSPHVPGYFTFDARLGWFPVKGLELSVVGQNLWQDRHPEFGDPATRQEIPRSVYGKVTWHF